MAAAQEFFSAFQGKRADLDSRIDSFTTGKAADDVALKQIIDEVQELRKNVNDEAWTLPSHDQRSYEIQLGDLERRIYELKAKAMPKSKFAFKRKTAPAKENDASTSTQAQTDRPAISQSAQQPNASPALISNSRRYLTMKSLSPPSSDVYACDNKSSSDLSLSGLDHCVVNLLRSSEPAQSAQQGDPPRSILTAVHIRNIRSSLLLLGNVKGSALLHDLHGCTVVIACQQLRVHTSRNCRFLIHAFSDAVIEDSRGLLFGHYPDALPVISELGKQEREHVNVHDFSHLKNTASPNWTALPELDQKHEEWTRVLAKCLSYTEDDMDEATLDAVLEAALPTDGAS